MQHSIAYAVSLATIAGIFDETQRGIVSRLLADDLSRVVFGAIVYHDDFRVPAILSDAGEDPLKRLADASAFVVCRQYDAVGEIQSCLDAAIFTCTSY